MEEKCKRFLQLPQNKMGIVPFNFQISMQHSVNGEHNTSLTEEFPHIRAVQLGHQSLMTRG